VAGLLMTTASVGIGSMAMLGRTGARGHRTTPETVVRATPPRPTFIESPALRVPEPLVTDPARQVSSPARQVRSQARQVRAQARQVRSQAAAPPGIEGPPTSPTVVNRHRGWGAVRVHATTAAGRVPPGLVLVIRGSPDDFDRSAGPLETMPPAAEGSAEAICKRPLSPDGFALVQGLRVGGFELACIEDAEGRIVAGMRLLLAPGRTEDIRVRIRSTPRDALVRVRDEMGKPIANASIWAGGHTFGRGGFTDRDGLVLIEDWKADSLRLSVSAKGYAPHIADDVSVPATDASIDVTLERGATLQVHLRDQDGRPVAADSVKATLAPVSIDGRYVAGTVIQAEGGPSAQFELPDMPLGTVTLTARIAGRDIIQEHHTRSRHATIAIPEHGSLAMRWNEPMLDESRYWIEIYPSSTRHATKAQAEPRRPPVMASFTHLLTVDEKRAGRAELGVVFPGSYVAVIKEVDYSKARRGMRDLLSLSPIEVQAGQHLSVLVDPALDRTYRPVQSFCHTSR
jgi:hypothetical protein